MRRSALEFKSVYNYAVFAKTRGTLVPALERIINQRIAFVQPDYPVSTQSFTQKINDGMQWDLTAQGDGFWRLIYASRSTPNMDKQTVAFRNLLMKNEEADFVHKEMLQFIDGIALFNDADLGEHEITDRKKARAVLQLFVNYDTPKKITKFLKISIDYCQTCML